MKSLPSENQPSIWKDQLRQNGAGEWQYVETSFGKFDQNTIDIMVKFHTAKGIKSAVEQEVAWFSRAYSKPHTVSQHPPASIISDFQELLYSNRYDEICQPHGMPATELATICVNRWLSDDHICWLMKTLTDSQTDTYCIYLNGALKRDPKTFRRFSRPGQQMPSKFVFAINVGCGQAGKTYFGTDEMRGCHWALCHVDMTQKRIVYGDSLAWPAPEGLLNQANKYIKAASNGVDDVSNYTFSMCHDPANVCPRSGSHRCAQSCAKFYPLQTCGSICGVVVMAVSAIACQNVDFFYHISTAYGQDTKHFPSIFLQTPSRFSKYLRLVVASWITSNSIDILYIVPVLWQQRVDDSFRMNKTHENDGSTESKINDTRKPGNVSGFDASKHVSRDNEGSSNGSSRPDPDKNENGVSKLEKDEKAVKSIPKAKVSAKEKRHKCSKCSVSFTIKYSLKGHMKEQHPFSSPDTSEMDGNSICHDCGFKCRRITDLRKHLTRSHNVIFRTESLIMQNMSGK